ncbi:MAG: hypothetical protein E6Q76_01130 [Rhizobium sp.]|nr:MAG: hypothetical protein E6Q76_01130 [Rhizobium sp.]
MCESCRERIEVLQLGSGTVRAKWQCPECGAQEYESSEPAAAWSPFQMDASAVLWGIGIVCFCVLMGVLAFAPKPTP